MDSPKSTQSCDNGRRTPTQRSMWSKFTDANIYNAGYADVDEIGWGDSPEPLKIDHNFIPKKKALNETPTSYRTKKIVRPSKRTALVLAAEQELAIIKQISQSILGNKANEVPINKTPSSTSTASGTISTDSKDINSNMSDNKSSVIGPSTATYSSKASDINSSDVQISKSSGESQDLTKLLEDDDDVWLSQVDLGESCQTPQRGKNALVKSRSENQLESPSPNRSASFRRSYSFQPSVDPSAARSSVNDCSTSTQHQPLKKQKSFHVDLLPGQTQCTAEQIEQKRLQAIYRREFREIERRKLEAQKRLNERRARLASGAPKR